MKKTILEIYALSICFIATIFLIFHLSEGLYNFIGVVSPDLTMSSYKYEYHQSNERYKNHCCKKNKKSETEKSEAEITKLRTENYKIELRSEARSCLQKITKNIIYILLAGMLLFVHWKLSKNARENQV